MSLFRTRTNAPVATPQYTGLQMQTASSALPIPIVYGTTRVAPNLIWSGNFQNHAQYGGSGGKGGGGSQVSGYTYSSAIVFAIGEGPIVGLGTVWRGRGTHQASDFYLSLFQGTAMQPPWGYLVASFPQAALAYRGTAYAATSYFDLGQSASLDTIAFEVAGRLAGGAPVNGKDCDPASVIGDFLTNPQYGVGFPAASLDAGLFGVPGDGSYQTWCQATGLALSPCLKDQEPARTTLARWLQLTGATAIWSAGRLKILPLGDAPVTGTVAFVPNLTPAMDLGDDDFVHDDDGDPLQVSRGDVHAAPNLQRLEILDRSNAYSATPVEARDQNAIETNGLVPSATITAHEICDLGVAAVAAQLILQRGLYVRNAYAFRLSWDYGLLEPMDVVTLTDAGLGLAKTPVRIVAIEEDASGLLAVTAEELPGVGTASTYPVAGATNAPINRAVAPAPVNPPLIFEPPPDLTGDAAQVWVGLSGGANGLADPNWGGASVWVSTDNASYTQVGAVTMPARMGVLTAALVAPSAASASDILAVSLAESAGVLSIASGGQLLCMVDGEIIAATSATLTGQNAYALGGLKRRVYGQRGGPHAVGAGLLVLDAAVFEYAVPAANIGQPLWLKFASVNMFGAAPQDLSTCVAYPFRPVGSGLFGPTAQEIAAGTSFDEGLGSAAVTQVDDYGLASDPYTSPLDDGLASDNVLSLPIASGGTGGTSPVSARTALGAAASGTNADITSLTQLAGIGIGTAVDTVTNRLAVKSAAALFDNTGAGVQIAINKATATGTGVLLYQTGYSGRAYAGLIGSDRYRISVSSAGTSFLQALDIDPATGHVGLAGYTADGNALGVSGTSFLFAAGTDSCRLAFNKLASANDASLTFQTAFSTRAIAGLVASDGYQLKVSPDGSTFYQVYVADQATGNLTLKALLTAASYAVASLPTGPNGAIAFASNGRKVGEAAGAGTGVLCVYSHAGWRRLSDDTIVIA